MNYDIDRIKRLTDRLVIGIMGDNFNSQLPTLIENGVTHIFVTRNIGKHKYESHNGGRLSDYERQTNEIWNSSKIKLFMVLEGSDSPQVNLLEIDKHKRSICLNEELSIMDMTIKGFAMALRNSLEFYRKDYVITEGRIKSV